jgi:hypothetical protein
VRQPFGTAAGVLWHGLHRDEPLAHGLRLMGAVSVLAVAAALVIYGGILFARRDLG